VYTERSTSSAIFNGEHRLTFDEAISDEERELAPVVDWRVSFSEAVFDQPDKTQFSAYWLPPSNDNLPDLPGAWIALRPSESTGLGWAQHIWQKVTESSTQLAGNLKLPFLSELERDGYAKFGFFGDAVERSYTQESFSNADDPDAFYISGWDDPWSAVFAGQDHPMFASIYDVDYDGQQRIGAVYGMVDMPLGEQFNLIGGARVESTSLQTQVYGESGATWFPPGGLVPISFAGDPTAADVDFRQSDLLPQIGAKWSPDERWTVTVNAARTVARQTFRELTPILQQEFLGGPIFIGNPDLTMSELENWDVRLDLTPFEGGLLSFSWFSKEITSPIETVQEVAPEFTYTTVQNYPKGTIDGIEIDLRQDFATVAEWMTGFKPGMNATFIESSVDLPTGPGSLSQELGAIGFPTSSRDMTNTPEYLFNVYFTQDIDETGTQFGLFYTLTGDTLVEGAGYKDQPFIAYVPDVYALPIGTLNFTLQQELFIPGFKAFFQAKNLLNPEIQTVYRSQYIAGDVLNTSYTAGVDFAFGLSLQLDF